MISGLRKALQDLTTPPPELTGEMIGRWLDEQITEITKLKKIYHHDICLHARLTPESEEHNCFTFALGIQPGEIRDMCLGPIFPGNDFVQMLLEDGLLQRRALSQHGAANGDIVLYLANGVPLHAGRWSDRTVISKWGAGKTHIWRHGLYEIPECYGTEVEILAPISAVAATEGYQCWASEQGL